MSIPSGNHTEVSRAATAELTERSVRGGDGENKIDTGEKRKGRSKVKYSIQPKHLARSNDKQGRGEAT